MSLGRDGIGGGGGSGEEGGALQTPLHPTADALAPGAGPDAIPLLALDGRVRL